MIKPPGYLSAGQKKEFETIAKVLLDIGIMSDLDCDALGRYIQSQEECADCQQQSFRRQPLWRTELFTVATKKRQSRIAWDEMNLVQ